MQGNVLVLTHWSYKDALIQTYTLPYLEIIRKILPEKNRIILVTSEQKQLCLSEKEVSDINKRWEVKNMSLYLLPYERFGWRKLFSMSWQVWQLVKLVKRNNVKTIHAFCTPAGSIAFLLAKMTGKELIIDSYEPHAEAMVENNTWSKKGLAFRLLFKLEKLQTKYAGEIIATNSGMKEYAKDKFNVVLQNMYVKPACVDLARFLVNGKNEELAAELALKGKIVCVYAGKLGGIYLKEEVFDFIKVCHTYWGDNFRFLMLTNASKDEVNGEMLRVNLPAHIVLQKFVPHENIAQYLSLADFAINPVKPVPTKKFCTPIKDGEYWATGLPVVITKDISDDSLIIEKNNIGYVMKALTNEEYQNAIRKIEELLNSGKEQLKQRIRTIAEKYRSYHIAEDIYSKIYS